MKTFKEFLSESLGSVFTGKEKPTQLIKKERVIAYHVSKSPSLNINKLKTYTSDESIRHHMHVGTRDQSIVRAEFTWTDIGYEKDLFLYKVTLDTTKMVPTLFQDDDPEFEALNYEKQGYTTLCYMNAHESEGDRTSIVVMNKSAILNLIRVEILRQDFE